jgi:hypothetical protein
MKKLITIILGITFLYSCSNNNDSSAVVPEIVTIPAAPTNLNYTIKQSVTTPSGDAILNLTWIDNSNNETAFRIQRKPEGSSNWIEDSEVYSNKLSKSITTYHYSNMLRYYRQDQYRIYAVNSAGKSEYSNVIQIEEIKFPNGPCTHCVN